MTFKFNNIPFNKLLLFVCALALILFIYWPGLTGAFMLDDMSSLPTLYSSMESCGFWCGVMSGTTGPTGRPVSLLTFALQADSWPNPYAFKFLNLLIHLVNTILVFFIVKLIIKRLNPTAPSFYVALISSLLWALWPLQVSSVLYVIQRMALLSSLFLLIGVLFYLICRFRLENTWSGQLSKWLLLCSGLAICGLLSLYSKESGVLLLVYICVLEGILFRPFDTKHHENVKYLRLFRWGCLILPFTIFILFLLIRYIGQADHYFLIREFSLSERVLTQGLVLIDYLKSLYFPNVSSLGLYHDDYPVSSSLIDPISTLFSWFFITSCLLAGWLLRKKFILFSLAIFWFIGGHILESTILPLELYFEHRNYLPVIFLTVALVFGVSQLISIASRASIKYVYIFISIIYMLVILFVTYSQSKLWGDEIQYGVIQAHEHQDSVRARALLIDVYSRLGEFDKGFEEMLKMQRDFPMVPGIIVGHLEYACYDSKYPILPIDEIIPKLQKANFGYGVIVTIKRVLTDLSNNQCQVVSPDYVLSVIKALKSNPKFVGRYNMLSAYEISAYMMLGKYLEAVELFETMDLEPEHWPTYIGLLATIDRKQEAIKIAEKGIDELRFQPQYESFYEDVQRLKKLLEGELNN